jgi:predicted Rossmann-fold nucleotide-binding protein
MSNNETPDAQARLREAKETADAIIDLDGQIETAKEEMKMLKESREQLVQKLISASARERQTTIFDSESEDE